MKAQIHKKKSTGLIWNMTGSLLLVLWVIDYYIETTKPEELSGDFRVVYLVAPILAFFCAFFGYKKNSKVFGVILMFISGILLILAIMTVATLRNKMYF